jgi:aminopeptidase N
MRRRFTMSILIMTALGALLASSSAIAVEVTRYRLDFQLDPANQHLSSQQRLSLINGGDQPAGLIEFALSPALEIESIAVIDSQGASIQGDASIADATVEGRQLTQVTLGLLTPIAPGQEARLEVNLRLRPTEVSGAEGKSLHSLAVGQQGCSAISAEAGHIPIFAHPDAPFELSLSYPEGYLSCAPGDRTSSRVEDGWRIDTYSSEVPLLPVFSIADYRRLFRRQGDLDLELLAYPDRELTQQTADEIFRVLRLYHNRFGAPPWSSSRIAVTGPPGSSTLEVANVGNAVFFTDAVASQPWHGLEPRLSLLAHASRELFHSWNKCNLTWEGPLRRWFVEGGASFVAAWAIEQLLGADEGAMVRLSYAQRCIDDRAYSCETPLAVGEGGGEAEEALAQAYGALVWEQLRAAVGDGPMSSALSELFRRHGGTRAGLEELIACFDRPLQSQARGLIQRWTGSTLRVDLSIASVAAGHEEKLFRNQVVAKCDGESEVEVVTDIGFRTSEEGPLGLVELRCTAGTVQSLEFDTQAALLYVEVDPRHRVPQTDLENDTWRGVSEAKPVGRLPMPSNRRDTTNAS